MFNNQVLIGKCNEGLTPATSIHNYKLNLKVTTAKTANKFQYLVGPITLEERTETVKD